MTTWADRLPEARLETFAPRPPLAPTDERALIRAALSKARADAFLAAASSSGALVVVVNDPQRATGTAPILQEIVAAAPSPFRLRVVIAAGTHRATGDERRAHEAALAAAAPGAIDSVVWHDARAPETLDPVGAWRLQRDVARATHVLAIGSLEPHYFAGVTGAHKSLTVGIAAFEDIEHNHQHALSPDAAPLRLDGNPVHEGIATALASLAQGRHLFAVNEVRAAGLLAACTAGAPLAALAEGLPAVQSAFAHTIPSPLDIVIASVAPPLDRDLYQADKGIKNVESAVRPGGAILLEAPCPSGAGPDQFIRLLEEAPTHPAALSLVARRGYRLGDHKAVRLRALTDPARRAVRVAVLATPAGGAAARRAGFPAFTDPAAAAQWIRETLGPGSHRGAVVEDAGNVVLRAESRPE